jgi:hypothetical protein
MTKPDDDYQSCSGAGLLVFVIFHAASYSDLEIIPRTCLIEEYAGDAAKRFG